MAAALAIVGVRGSGSGGQLGVLGEVFGGYIEETVAASTVIPSQNQLLEVNSLSAIPMSTKLPRSGLLATIQENSILSRNSILTDVLDEFSDRGNQIIAYTVQEGDTLSFIASDFGVSLNTIIWANNLKNVDAISPGTELKIPPVTGVIHRVKSGDTISSIAKKYGIESEKIISFNSLPQESNLQINEELIIPDGKPQGRAALIQRSISRSFAYLPNLNDFFALPVNGFNWGRIHGRNGVDVANSCGTSISAAAAGTVVTAINSGWNGGFGKFVKISHPNGTETLYAHASQVLVSAGRSVAKGQKIALMGSTGRSTGCHLHFEVHGARNPLAKN